jgi:hypothetical protein
MKKIYLIIMFSFLIISSSFTEEKNCENIKTVKKYLECKNDPNRSLKNFDLGDGKLGSIKKKISESKILKTFKSFKNTKSLSGLAK